MTSAPVRLGPLVLTRPIGQGGMGTVWHARHPEGVDVAVKVLKQEYAKDKALLEAFRFEVRSVASLDHPSVVRVFDYGVVPEAVAAASGGELAAGSPWLSMEHAGGGTLGDKARLGQWDALRDILGQILDGLAHSHARDLVHRDLKPRNVLLHGEKRITITDFGIAHALSRVSPAHAQAGTPGYMAPEQIRGEWRELGPWTDLYSLGCLVWRLTTGNPPFVGKNKIAVLRAQLEGEPAPLVGRFTLPPGVLEWALKLIERDPARRFANAADAAHALRSLDDPRTLSERAAGAGAAADESPTNLARSSSAPPPVPEEWRPPNPPTTVRPKGTGLALFILRPWPIVGRGPVQDELWATFRRVARGRKAEVVAITGAAGVGKSRLARWLAERALETGAAWALRVRFDPEGKRDLRSAVHGHLRLRDLEPAQAYDRLVAWVLHRGSATPEDEAARLCGLLYPEASGSSGAPIVHLATAPEQHAAWLQLFDRLATDRPLVLVADDVHRSEDVHALLAAAAGSERALLVIATARRGSPRDAELDALVAGPACKELRLELLSKEDQRSLVEAGVGLTPRLAQALARRTGGNPLFAVRIVTDWARQGALVPTSTGFDLREGAESRLPATIGEHFAARIDPFQQRSPTAALALEILAVLGGQKVREDEWARVCDEAGFPLDQALLDAIVEAGLAEGTTTAEGTARWTFEHALLKDALVQRASDAGRLLDHHRACARALQRDPRITARERAILHLVEAGDRPAALAAIRALADEALRRAQHPRLVALLDFEERLLDEEGVPDGDPARIPGLADRALHLLSRRGDSAEAIAMGLAAHTRATVTNDVALRARASRAALAAEDAAGRLGPEHPLFAQAEQWHRASDDRAGLLAVLRRRGACRRTSGDAPGAERDLRAALELAQGLPDALEVARLLEALAEVIAGQGRIDEAEPLLLQAQEVYRRAGNAIALAHVDALAAGLSRARGDLVHSLERARRAQFALRKLQAPTAFADLQSGLVRLARGELATAKRELGDVAKGTERAPALALVARGGLLVCAAGARDWQDWEETMAAWKALASDRVAVGADAAWPLEWAARRASDAGETTRAREAYALAAHRYTLVGDDESVKRVRQRLRDLPQ